VSWQKDLACLRDVVSYSALCQIHSSYGVLLEHSTGVTCCLFLDLSIHVVRSLLRRAADFGRKYFRSLLDPTPVMLQRLAVPALSLATAEDGPQYFSRPGCGLAVQSTCNGANSGLPAYFVPVTRIALWTAFRAQQASLL
jgi:hypothetical protein